MTIPAIPQQADPTEEKIKIGVGRVRGAGFACVSPGSSLERKGESWMVCSVGH